jgi:hypothetical protein
MKFLITVNRGLHSASKGILIYSIHRLIVCISLVHSFYVYLDSIIID